MAKINFTKGEKFYTAEFQINGPTAIHIERNKVGPLYLKQKSVENGQYDFVKDFGYNRGGDLTIDTAIQGVVYPMWIKIESASEPTLAEMVEGEQSGGGAGTESTMEYLDVSGLDKSYLGFKVLLKMAYQTKIVGVDGVSIAIAPFGLLALEGGDMGANLAIAIAIDFNTSAVIGSQLTDYSVILSEVYTEEQLAAIPRITKEQFYNLEA